MKRVYSIGLLAGLLAACGGGSTGNQVAGIGASPPATMLIQVNPVGTGSGRVTSVPSGIDCAASCGARMAAGTTVTLTAVANPGSHFDGYGKDCSGLTCVFTVAKDAVIFASFTADLVPLPPQQTLQHSLVVGLSGAGTVISTPEGVSCPGSCSASFAEGTTIGLTATAAAGQVFAGWTGACSGTDGCVISLGSDAAVTAQFAPDPCAGITVPALPAEKTVSVRSWDEDPTACGSPFSDGAGNLYLQTQYELNSSAGFGASHENFFVPLNSGFTAFSVQMAPEGTLTAFAADGTVLSSAPMIGYMSDAGLQANGGVVAVEGSCYVSDTIQIRRIDGDGQLTGEFTLAGEHCLGWGSGYLSIAADAQERILLSVDGGVMSGTGIATGRVASRWYDPTGQPLTGWFETPAADSITALLPVPLIGGGVAIQAGGKWNVVPSGKAELLPAPAAFGSKSNIATVLGGKAYAVFDVTNPGNIDLVEPGGELCGSLSVPGYILSGGGSLVSVPAEGRDPVTNLCPVTSYPKVLE